MAAGGRYREGSHAAHRSTASVCDHAAGDWPAGPLRRAGRPGRGATPHPPARRLLVLLHRVLTLLLARYHAYALDQRGHGDSERPACCYAIDDLAADIVAFLDAVEIERATLVGHSASGFIARRVAETHPDRVARLVLINCAVTLPTQVRREMQAAVRGFQDPLSVAFVRELHASVTYVPLPEPIFERLVAQNLKAPARVWRDGLEGLLGFDDAAELGRIVAPTLLLWGSGTGCSPGRSRNAWRPRSPGPGCEWSRRRATART